MNSLIIEDEMPSVRKLERMLVDFKVEVLGSVPSVKKAIDWLQKNKHPDIIFLDVELSDGVCFEIFEKIEVCSKIIFTTAYSTYSIKAFDYNSISYLLKPIKKEQINKVMLKARRLKDEEEDFIKLKEMFKNTQVESYKSSFTIKNGKKIKIIKEEEVLCFYSFDNATFVKTIKFNAVIDYSLSGLGNILNPEHFFRVNRTYIVHINAIKDIVSYTNSRLQLKLHNYEEAEIIVSRERVKDFKNWID
ncbi:LytTR family DNA-binding domain-containing protein [Tenacibaculum sp. 190524A02b]|uniref:LytR/AlgR family response regulator transcription factor n=1 Tax=Tenacibaculum vairaonense TaxID=3137860 RepID=UPI0031FB5BA8